MLSAAVWAMLMRAPSAPPLAAIWKAGRAILPMTPASGSSRPARASAPLPTRVRRPDGVAARAFAITPSPPSRAPLAARLSPPDRMAGATSPTPCPMPYAGPDPPRASMVLWLVRPSFASAAGPRPSVAPSKTPAATFSGADQFWSSSRMSFHACCSRAACSGSIGLMPAAWAATSCSG